MTAVGIDVGKATLDVAVDGTPRVARFANTAAGCIRKLLTIVNAKRRDELRLGAQVVVAA